MVKAWGTEYAPGKTNGKAISPSAGDWPGRLVDSGSQMSWLARVASAARRGIKGRIVVGHVVAVEVVGQAVAPGPARPGSGSRWRTAGRRTGSRGWSGRPGCSE